MTSLLTSPRIQIILATGICSLFLNSPARSQEAQPAPSKSQDTTSASSEKQSAQPEQARALLDQVKKSEQDRQVTVKQTEMARVKEDQEKAERDSNALKQSMESTTGLIGERTDHLSNLTAESKRLQHELAVAEARITAEKLKIDGLKALADAQGKSLSALDRHADEAKARTKVQSLELEMLQAGKLIPGEGREDVAHADLTKARKAQTAAESRTISEERTAYDAMKAATSKMAQAETKAAYAQRLADNDPALMPVEKAKPVAKVADKTDSDANIPKAIVIDPEKLAPIAAGPKSPGSSAKPTAKPAAAAAATTTSKAPKSTPTPKK